MYPLANMNSGHVECVYEPVDKVVPFGGIRRIVMSDDDEDDAYRLGDVCSCRPFHGYIRCFRSPCAGSWPTSHHFLSRQAGLPLMLRSLFLSAHFSGYFTYLCMTGLAVPHHPAVLRAFAHHGTHLLCPGALPYLHEIGRLVDVAHRFLPVFLFQSIAGIDVAEGVDEEIGGSGLARQHAPGRL